MDSWYRKNDLGTDNSDLFPILLIVISIFHTFGIENISDRYLLPRKESGKFQ